MNAESKLSMQTPIGTDSDALPDRRLLLRRILMVVIPAIVVVAATAWYLNTGRFVGTDNAYVKTDIASLSPQVSGTVMNVLVSENQAVTKGQMLLTLDDTNFRIGLANAEAQLQSALTGIQGDKARYAQKEASLAIMRGNVAFAEREFKRQSALAANNFVAAAKLDEARHTLESAQQKSLRVSTAIRMSCPRTFPATKRRWYLRLQPSTSWSGPRLPHPSMAKSSACRK